MKFGEVKDQPRGKNNLGDVILLAKPPQFETNDVQQEKEIELIKQVESINTDKIQEQLNQKKTNEITKKEEELKNLKNKTLPTQTQSDQFKAVQPKAAGRNLSDFASKENLLCTLSIRDITVFEQARDPQEIEKYKKRFEEFVDLKCNTKYKDRKIRFIEINKDSSTNIKILRPSCYIEFFDAKRAEIACRALEDENFEGCIISVKLVEKRAAPKR